MVQALLTTGVVYLDFASIVEFYNFLFPNCVWCHSCFLFQFIIAVYNNFHDDVIEWKTFLVPVLLWGEPSVTGGFPSQRPVSRSFDVSYDLRLDKRSSKQSGRWWFKTLSFSLWRHHNVERPGVPCSWKWVRNIVLWIKWIEIHFCIIQFHPAKSVMLMSLTFDTYSSEANHTCPVKTR